jgi:hypothetical protein
VNGAPPTGAERSGRPAPRARGQARIFVNYRRADAQHAAGRLADDLEDHFGEGTVFRDVRITYGDDFVEVMTAAARSCDVFLAVIGPKWATLTKDGVARIQHPDDYVRMEIEIALERPDVKVIPVLVGDVDMPDAGELPGKLARLARRNACSMRDRTWKQDLAGLIADVTQALPPDPEPVPPPDPDPDPGPEPDPGPVPEPDPQEAWGTAGRVAAAALVAGPVAWALSDRLHDLPSARGADRQPDLVAARERLLYYALERGVIWAVIGAVVLVLWAVLARTGGSPVSAALSGAMAGAVGGLVGGALFQGVKYSANPARGTEAVEISLGPLLRMLSYLVPALLIGWAFARAARGLSRAEGMAAGATAGFIAGWLTYAELPVGRMVSLALEALVLGGLLAVAAVGAARRAGGAAATEASASTARA